MNLLNVDSAKCVKCGICAEVCPSCILEMGAQGPYCDRERGCMACGHCVAVCPTGALDNTRCPLSEQTKATPVTVTAEQLAEVLKSRRSIRNFKPLKVKEEEITALLEVARYAPTAGNSQGLYYNVISDQLLIREIADITAEWMREELAAQTEQSRYFRSVLQVYEEKKKDIIARNAPHLVFAYARRLNLTGVSNCEQVWAYAELYAPRLGLGTTIAGFVQSCAIADYPPLLELLEVPRKQKIVGVMMLGYPQYQYHRVVTRQHLKVTFIN